MMPLIFEKMVQHYDREQPTVYHGIPMYMDTTGTRIADSGITVEAMTVLADNGTIIINHLKNESIHVTLEDKNKWNNYYDTMVAHTLDNTIHITEEDRANWDSKETEEGAQVKANIVQSNLNEHINNSDVHCTKDDKLNWSNKCTKEEIDNKFAMMEFNSDWKEAVQTYDDLFLVYPDPYAGWTVNVLDSGITYRFDGTQWVGISANAVPLATPEIDGLMSKQDKAKLDTVEEGANNYEHPDDDEHRHVSVSQIEYWDNKADKINATYILDGLMSKEDKYKLDMMEEGATNYVEPEFFPATKIQEDENHRFVTDEEKTYWSNKANSNLASINLDGLMSKADKVKLNSIEYYANNYVHPEKHDPSIIAQDEEHRFVTDEQIMNWNNKSGSETATPESSGTMSAEDKKKLDSIEFGANNYVHPEKHDPTIIAQDKDNRFVTDADIINWNNKKDQKDIVCGTGIFNGVEGTVILHELGGTNYTVSITILDDPTDVGTIYVEPDNYSCVVKNTGSNKTSSFTYTLIKYYK